MKNKTPIIQLLKKNLNLALIAILLVGLLWGGLKAQRALAAPSATLTVTTTTDELVIGGTGCSLREAIMDANADSNTYPECGSGGSGADTITLPAGTYTLAIAGDNEDANATGDLDVTDADGLVINGAGARSSIISANSIDRVLHVVAGATLTLNGVTLRDGYATGNGTSREGSGIDMDGVSLTVNDSRITQNINPAGNHDGAGINTGCSGCTIIIDRSLIDHNQAGDSGGGIDVPTNATVTIRNTTISNNQAGRGAALSDIFNPGSTITLEYVTVTGNYASGTVNSPGGIRQSNATVNVGNSIISGNTNASGSSDCTGSPTSQGYNVVGSNGAANGCPNNGTTDIVPTGATSTVLDTMLANNGGGTDTHALQNGSPALEQIPSGTNGCGTTYTTDQRGELRPGTRNQPTNRCEIGAWEAQTEDPTAVTLQSISATNQVGWVSLLVGLLTLAMAALRRPR